ncbi:4,5-dihydroxyphthalate dehydrogenase, partial [Klebsiella michiganensis]|uniref:hypothetical protein n=1 Tax=Klebsiella michiganensis TaxID=1134687 RepID=UPI000E3B255E
VDIVRLLAGSRATRLRASVGRWDSKRPTEGAYSALIWFENGAYASLSYSGYGHFNSDEWMGWIGEMGDHENPDAYGAARRRLATIASSNDEAQLKAAGTYGGAAYKPPSTAPDEPARRHQHFGPVILPSEPPAPPPLPASTLLHRDPPRATLPLTLPT